MNETFSKPAKELGLTLSVPFGVNPENVAARKAALIHCGAADGRTLNGKILAEQIALDAEILQTKIDARELAKRETHLAAANFQMQGGQLARMDAQMPGSNGSGHLLTVEEAIVLTPQQAAR